MNENIKKELEELKSKKNDLEKEISKLDNLLNVYSDLNIITKNKNKFYCSKSVNSLVSDVFFTYTCGCCGDADVVAYPYFNYVGIKIYSDPCYFIIGSQRDYEQPNSYWKEAMEINNISQVVINQVEQYFADKLNKYKEELLEELEELG